MIGAATVRTALAGPKRRRRALNGAEEQDERDEAAQNHSEALCVRRRSLHYERRSASGHSINNEDMRRLLLALLGAAVISSCDTEDDDVALFDTTVLVESLRAGGLIVDRRGTVSQPFFSASGSIVTVNGEDVQAFEYRDIARAEAEARTVSPDGSTIGTTAVSWIGPPHFHRRDRVIVLYVGDAATVRAALTNVMGPQFAGR
jgi:hypothetical protein